MFINLLSQSLKPVFRLNSLTLKNFRRYEKLSINFDEKLTLIVGVNGSGKTTILEAAAIAVGSFLTKIDGAEALSIQKDDARLKAYDFGTSDDVVAQYPVSVSATGDFEFFKDKPWTRSLTGPKSRMTVNEAKNIINFGKDIQSSVRQGDKGLILPVLAYYGTGRLWDYHRNVNKDFKSSVATRTNGYKNCLDGTANLKLMLRWFEKKTIQSFRKQDSGEDNTLNVVFDALGKCFQRISGLENIKIQYNFDTKSLEILYEDEFQKVMRLSFDQLSDGYKGAISLIADIAYRMAVLNPQLNDRVLLDTHGIVFIDEVDLHLHPLWQKNIISDLVTIFPKVQFIVTSHAASVISSVKKNNLRILKDGEVFSMNGEVYGKDVKSIMDEIMGVSDRPDEVESLFDKFNGALKEANWGEAESALEEISKLRGGKDPELTSGWVKLKLEKMRRGGLV